MAARGPLPWTPPTQGSGSCWHGCSKFSSACAPPGLRRFPLFFPSAVPCLRCSLQAQSISFFFGSAGAARFVYTYSCSRSTNAWTSTQERRGSGACARLRPRNGGEAPQDVARQDAGLARPALESLHGGPQSFRKPVRQAKPARAMLGKKHAHGSWVRAVLTPTGQHRRHHFRRCRGTPAARTGPRSQRWACRPRDTHRDVSTNETAWPHTVSPLTCRAMPRRGLAGPPGAGPPRRRPGPTPPRSGQTRGR